MNEGRGGPAGVGGAPSGSSASSSSSNMANSEQPASASRLQQFGASTGHSIPNGHLVNGHAPLPQRSNSYTRRMDPEKGEPAAAAGADQFLHSQESTGLLNGHTLPSKRARSQSISELDDLREHISAVTRQWRKLYEREGWHGLKKAIASTASQTASLLAHRFNRLQRRRRYTLVATLALVSVILLLNTFSSAAAIASSSSRYSRAIGPNKALSILASDGTEAAKIDRSIGKYRSQNKAKVLESFTNPYGFISLIDPYAGGVFNPTVIVLPDTVGAGWKHLLVARGPEKYEVIDGSDTRWEQLLGCFLLPMTRPYLNLPYLARESELEKLNLTAERVVDYQRCENPTFDQFIGPEDPRLFLTNDGQPLLIYSQTGRSPMVCRAIYIIDARVVVPGLTEALKRGGWNPPIVFKEQTDLIRSDQSNIEKNWSPFLGERDELHFHVSLVPQRIYKYVEGLTLRPIDPHTPDHNCITDVIGAEMNRVHLHHATPLLRVTLCRRGECRPTIHNTVLFGIIHIKYHPLPYLFYERRVITLNVTSPYEYLSVSKPLTYSGTNQADPIFTVSIAWDHPTAKHGLGLNHGFLDDVVMTTFGVSDYGSAYIDVLARDMLTDHTLCSGIKGSKMAWSN